MKNKTGKLYMDNLQAVTLPTELVKKLKEKGWKHTEEMIIVYHEDTDTLEVVPARKAKIEIRTPRGRLELPIERLTQIPSRVRCVLRIT